MERIFALLSSLYALPALRQYQAKPYKNRHLQPSHLSYVVVAGAE
jgi:hypothetical protein